MPYTYADVEDPEQISECMKTERLIFGLTVSDDQIQRAKRLKITCSAFDDPEDDWTLIELFDGEGKVIYSEMIE